MRADRLTKRTDSSHASVEGIRRNDFMPECMIRSYRRGLLHYVRYPLHVASGPRKEMMVVDCGSY